MPTIYLIGLRERGAIAILSGIHHRDAAEVFGLAAARWFIGWGGGWSALNVHVEQISAILGGVPTVGFRGTAAGYCILPLVSHYLGKIRPPLLREVISFSHLPWLFSGAAMSATPTELFAFLERLGISFSTVSHPPLFTVEESQASQGRVPGAHSKNLFLKDKNGIYFLVVVCEDAVIELRSLHRRLVAKGRLSFGSAEAMNDLLGVTPGSVTPFAVINDVSGKVAVVLDQAMLVHEILNYHPLVNTMTTSISRAGLMTFLNACGHEPRILSVSDDGTGLVVPSGDVGDAREAAPAARTL